MTLTINLTPELERRLIEEAKRRGLPAEQIASELLERHLAPRDRAADAVSLLQSWIDHGDAAEQREIGDYLVRVLDEDRPSNRKFVPAGNAG